MADMAVSANSAGFRALGGQLYIHATGWNATSGGTATRTAIKNLFPAPPMVETGGPNGAPNFFLPMLKTPGYWNTADSNINNGISGFSDSQMATLVSSWAPYTDYVGPVGSQDERIPFADASFDQFRRNCLAGGTIAIDLPPQFYWDKPGAYRTFVADEIKWGRANNLRVVVLFFARDSGQFFEETKRAVADLIWRGAYPTAWASNQYCSTRTTEPATPIGDERNGSSGNYTALRLAEFENGFDVTSATTNSTYGNRNPQYLVDDVVTGNYGSIDQIGQYYQFDFGATKPVHGVGLAFYLGTSRNYTVTVQTSTDGTTWTNRLTNVTSTRMPEVEDFYFNPVNARYVRVINGGNSSNNFLALHEARCLGWRADTTYFSNITATAPNAQSGYPATSLVDRDQTFSTRCSVANLNEYMQFDIGATRTLKGVTVAVYLGDTRSQRFDVQVSTNGTSWTTVLTGAQTSGAWLWNEDFRFSTPQSARYVRLVNKGNTSSNFPNGMALTRAGAWGQ